LGRVYQTEKRSWQKKLFLVTVETEGLLKTPCLEAVQKCSDARRAKNRTARRIWIYVERCGLQRNTTDEHFSTAPLRDYFSPVEPDVRAEK
jgi:hypothetical protein